MLQVLALSLLPIWAQVTSTGVVAGNLVNATPGGAVPATASVTLASLSESGWKTERTGPVDSQGHFQFDGLSRGSGTMYLPIVSYGNAFYYPADPVNLADGDASSIQITVYDSTQSDDSLQYDRAAIMIAGIQQDSLSIMEMNGLNNTDSRTVVGVPSASQTDAISARFPLPPGASDVQPRAGIVTSQVVPTSDGFGLAWPVLPGRHELAFSYQLPYSGNELSLERTMIYPATTMTVYLPEGGLRLVSERLLSQGTTDLGGTRYQVFTATNLNRGEQVKMKIQGFTNALNPPTPTNYNPYVLGVGLTTMLGGIVAALVLRRRTSATSSPDNFADDNEMSNSEPSDFAVLAATDERQELIQEIAALDERFDQNLLPEGAYRELRAALLNRVIALTAPKSARGDAIASPR